MELKFTKSTDAEHEIQLDSYLISASWRSGSVFAGNNAAFEVRTALVGNGAKIKIKGLSEKGKDLGKISDVIRNNIFVGQFEIPEKIDLDDHVYFKVELPDNNLRGESVRIPVFLMPKIKSIGWSAEEARRGDTLTLSAELENVRDGTEVTLVIYEDDADSAHDRIAELTGIVRDKKIEELWEFDYYDATVKINTEEIMQKADKKLHYAYPEYFFTLKIGGEELARDQQSGLLKFVDEFNFQPLDENGNSFPNAKYILLLADDKERRGTLDDEGRGREEGLPPGQVIIVLPESKHIFGI